MGDPLDTHSAGAGTVGTGKSGNLNEQSAVLKAEIQKAHGMRMYQEDFLVEQNMDLVQQIARKRFAGRMPDDDLIQQGNIGLWEAARKWNGTGSFRAFACICIYHNMIDHVRRPSKPTGELSAAGEDKEAYLYCDDLEEMELGDEIRRAWPEGTTERRVLTLLASGMDKHAVAAQMGTGVRQIKRVAKRAWRGVERIRAEKTAGE